MNPILASRWIMTGVRYRLVFVLVGVVILGQITTPDFATIVTFQSILDRATVVGFLALGLTPVLIAGHIDLSIGSALSIVSVTTIALQPSIGNLPAAAVGVAVGILIGVVNATLVVVLKISSLVATLATLLILASLALLVTDSQPISSKDPTYGLPLARDLLAVFSPRSLMFIVAVLAMSVLLRATPAGRNIYAVGSNAPAATSAGINSNAYLFATFVLSGACVGIAGMLQSLSTATGSPVAGSVLLIPAITAVVIGGTRLEGGRGSSLATLGGVLALGALTALLEFNGIPTFTQAVYTGLLLIALITLDRLVGDRTSSPHRRTTTTSVAKPNTTSRGGTNEHTT